MRFLPLLVLFAVPVAAALPPGFALFGTGNGQADTPPGMPCAGPVNVDGQFDPVQGTGNVGGGGVCPVLPFQFPPGSCTFVGAGVECAWRDVGQRAVFEYGGGDGDFVYAVTQAGLGDVLVDGVATRVP